MTMENGAIHQRRRDHVEFQSGLWDEGDERLQDRRLRVRGYRIKKERFKSLRITASILRRKLLALRAQVQGLKQQTSWATFSDERLKNIKGRFTPGLKAVMQLQPVRYEYKPDNALGLQSSGQHIGFGAQAVQKIIPEAVSKNDKGCLLVNN